ncbi:MAG: hypothetical protein A2Y97_11025 [Nitrospirae bacterium RBG_13_39_12]|nr:MAG: hypothetical protein A2Y97_11025 [Nitrospirae bacterium RBG_13_39_12]
MHSKTKSSRFEVQSPKFKSPYVFRIFCFIFCLSSLICNFLLITSYLSVVNAEVRDRVVAFVDNTAITLSDLEDTYNDTLRVSPDTTKEEVLITMINRILLLGEANKLKLEAPSKDDLLREYIELRIKTFIRIKEEELIDFYRNHLGEFQGKEFDDVRDEIENYLTEKELNQRLKSHIKELRENSCIKIQ